MSGFPLGGSACQRPRSAADKHYPYGRQVGQRVEREFWSAYEVIARRADLSLKDTSDVMTPAATDVAERLARPYLTNQFGFSW